MRRCRTRGYSVCLAWVGTRAQRRREMLLEGENAVIYGGGGSIVGAVGCASAREGGGASVAGRTLGRLDDLARLRRVRDRIDREYARPLDIEALARGVHISAGHLSRQFRLAYGESPYAYLMTRRIERAMALLRRGGLSVTEVCFTVGCSSLGTFSTRFAELVGVPPSVYRRQAARATAGVPSCVAKQVMRPIRNREVRTVVRLEAGDE